MPSATYRIQTSSRKADTRLVVRRRKATDLDLYGSQVPLAGFTRYEERYNLEITEIPIRTPDEARQLIEMYEHSYIVRACLRYAANDALSSSDGSDRGFALAPVMSDGETPVPEDVVRVAAELFARRTSTYNIVGGTRLQSGIQPALGYGNGYMELGVGRLGESMNRSKDFAITSTQFLPTWQMFNLQTPQGQHLGYEQREKLTETTLNTPNSFHGGLYFPSWKIIDFCHDRDKLYGRSIWNPEETRKAWAEVKKASENLSIASQELSHNPNVHKMPPNTSKRQKRQYQDSHERKKAGGLISDFYVYSDAEIRKLFSGQSSVTPFIDNLLQRRVELVAPGMPLFYFPEFSRLIKGSRELNNQPALNYSRLRNSWCGMLADGIRRILDVEIYLRLGEERYYQLMYEYVGNLWLIQFPKWNIANYTEAGDETNKAYDDLDEDEVDPSATDEPAASDEGGSDEGDDKNNSMRNNRRVKRKGMIRKPFRENSEFIYL